MDMEDIARWAYVAFVIIAIIAGLVVGYMAYANGPNDTNVVNTHAYITLILLILGIIIGFVSITAKEVMPFLLATIAIIVASNANVWEPLNTIHALLFYWATYILSYIVAFAAPAAVIIAIKAVLVMAREK